MAKTAQERLATITDFAESAKASAAAAAECQALIATALADAQTKLAEISTAATQAAVAKTQVASEQSAIVESAKIAAAAIAESQTRAAAALADAQAKLTEITTAATQAVAAKTAITDDQAVIATKSDHIQKAQEHADKVRADLDRALTAATQQATDAEGLKARAQSATDNTAALLADIRTTKGAAETEAAAIATARQAAEESATVTKSLADKSGVVESRIADYEKRLAELETQCAVQLKTIESLLPGATGAGLAHAFNERRKGFLKPHDRWQWFFVGSVFVIMLLAGSGLWHVYHLQTVPTYDELVRLWLARLPVAGALLWLALHASRESALAKRLEEDYGYKAPALALTAPDVAQEEGDGLLTMEKVLALRLNADWVVLSACNTASGNGVGSEAISGLGRAFFYAGARALLVSNWPVETTSARALTTELFRRQATDPDLPRAQALRQAILWLLDGQSYVDPRTGRAAYSYAHPLFWAPFTLVGDGGASAVPKQ